MRLIIGVATVLLSFGVIPVEAGVRCNAEVLGSLDSYLALEHGKDFRERIERGEIMIAPTPDDGTVCQKLRFDADALRCQGWTAYREFSRLKRSLETERQVSDRLRAKWQTSAIRQKNRMLEAKAHYDNVVNRLRDFQCRIPPQYGRMYPVSETLSDDLIILKEPSQSK